MAKAVKKTLGYLGVDFQYRLVNAFFERPKFFKDLYSIIDQNMFTETYLKTIVGIMKEYYAKYESVPSYDMLKIKINEIAFNDDDAQFYNETLEKLKDTTTEGIDEVEDMAEKFFKQQNWVRVANEIIKIAGYGDMSKYDDCQKLMEEAMSVGRHNDDDMTSPLDSVEDDLSEESHVSIPTGISKLDETLGGGLDKGKLGLIIGPSGFGKTSMTTGLAAYAATYACEQNDFKGYKVLQIVFEDTQRDIHRKYFSRLTQVETCRINETPETTAMVRAILDTHPDRDKIRNNIRIMRLKSGVFSASDIRGKIKKLINEGFKPDMVIIDYFECVDAERGTKTLTKWEQEAKTMRCFENDAAELDIALWIPVQGNRDSISAELVTMDKAGGAIQKVQIAQVILSITRSVEDTKNQKATLSVLKNRSGAAGIVLNGIKFNNGTCTISCDEVIEFDDALSYDNYVEDFENKAVNAAKKSIIATINGSK